MVIGFKKLFWCHFAVKNAPLINESTNQRLEIVLAFMKAKGHSIWSKKYYFYRLETHNVHICNLTKCSIFCHWPLQRPTKAKGQNIVLDMTKVWKQCLPQNPRFTSMWPKLRKRNDLHSIKIHIHVSMAKISWNQRFY